MLNTCSIGRRWKSREGWSRPVLTGERGTLFPTLVGRVSSCGGFLVGWQGILFLVVTTTILVRRLICLRPLSGSRTATTGIGRVAGSVAGRSRLGVGRLEWFCGGHGPGETPGPFPNPEAKAWHGDGTALERVWESSTPPHPTVWTFWSSPLRDSRKVPFFIRTGCFPPPGGGLWTSASRPAGGFLQWVEVFGLWKACGRTGYSSEWRNLDRERLGSGRIPPVSGGIWDVERCVGR